MDDIWDCIIVGAGIVGSWTAYHLTKQGLKPLLLEQFALPHSRGSSHGQSRIIRKAYTQDVYTRMTEEAYIHWEKLEKETGKTLMKETGILLVQGQGKEVIEDTKKSMSKFNMPYELLNHRQLQERFPMFKLPPDHSGLLDPAAGLLFPGRIVGVLQKKIEEQGGVIQDSEKVQFIERGAIVKVTTNKKKYLARKVVITAGPWAKDLLDKMGVPLPLKMMPGKVFYFKTRTPQVHSAEDGCPVLLHYQEPIDCSYRIVYLIPVCEYGGLVKTMPGGEMYFRDIVEGTHSADNWPIVYDYTNYTPDSYRFVCMFPSLEFPNMVKLVTRGEPPPFYCHPDERDSRGNKELVEIVQKYIRDHLPGVDDTPSLLESCMYTMTPDKGFIIDWHPRCGNVIFGVGMSGQGFMRAPVIGKLLMEMVTRQPTSYNLGPFRLDRFEEKEKSKL